MANDITQLKQLQASINDAFESLYSITEKEPTNVGATAAAKAEIGKLAQMTSQTSLGPVFTILQFSLHV